MPSTGSVCRGVLHTLAKCKCSRAHPGKPTSIKGPCSKCGERRCRSHCRCGEICVGQSGPQTRPTIWHPFRGGRYRYCTVRFGIFLFFPFAFPGFPFLGFPLKHERGSGLHRCACRHGLLLVACPLVGLFSRSIPPPLEDYGAPAPTLEQTGGGLVNIHAKRCFSWRHLSRTAIVPLIHSIRLVL